MNTKKQKGIAGLFIAAIILISVATVWALTRPGPSLEIPDEYSTSSEYVRNLINGYEDSIEQMGEDAATAERIGRLDQYPDRVRFQMYRQLSQIYIRMLSRRVQCRSYILELASIAPLLDDAVRIPPTDVCSVPFPEEFRQINDELFSDRDG